jgi:hypothetical protein
MINKKSTKCYSKNVKHIRGSGFRDIIQYIKRKIIPTLANHAIDRGARAIIDHLLAPKTGKGLKKF